MSVITYTIAPPLPRWRQAYNWLRRLYRRLRG